MLITKTTKKATFAFLLLSGATLSARAAETAVPAALAAPGESVVLSVHAEGAQVYDCKAGADGKPMLSFREPVATLLVGGKTIGRHYAGPSWEHSDGSAVAGQVVGTAPGTVANDIPWLKLAVTSRRGSGVLSQATTVQRINTVGGKLSGDCYKAGTYESVPYSADYVFLRKG